jgi:hypothetical protein
MAVIDKFRNIVTVIETFELPIEDMNKVVADYTELIRVQLKGRIGFISCSLHYDEDEKILLSYGQWKSRNDYELFLQDKEISEQRDRIYSRLIRSSLTKVVFAQ